MGRYLSEKEHFCTSVQLQFRSFSHSQNLALTTWPCKPQWLGEKRWSQLAWWLIRLAQKWVPGFSEKPCLKGIFEVKIDRHLMSLCGLCTHVHWHTYHNIHMHIHISYSCIMHTSLLLFIFLSESKANNLTFFERRHTTGLGVACL